MITGDLEQPAFALPFTDGQVWNFTGGPHPVWGDSTVWGARSTSRRRASRAATTPSATPWPVAPGVIVRADDNTVVLDL